LPVLDAVLNSPPLAPLMETLVALSAMDPPAPAAVVLLVI